jgi:hypothetical protein
MQFLTRALLVPILLVAACSFSPVSRKFEPGQEPLVVFSGTGRGTAVDLFAVSPDGGDPVQFTFTQLRESMPRLSSGGQVVAFVRDRGGQPGEDLVVMNLLSGAERVLELPEDAGAIEALGWSSDDTSIYVRTATATWQVSVPPAPLEVTLLQSPHLAADSALTVILGTPAFATARECDDGGICVTGPSGETSRLHQSGTRPFRIGGDAIGWVNNGKIELRSLGPGAVRQLEWRDTTIKAIEATYAEP